MLLIAEVLPELLLTFLWIVLCLHLIDIHTSPLIMAGQFEPFCYYFWLVGDLMHFLATPMLCQPVKKSI